LIPESQKQHNDLIDIIIEASQKIQDVEGADGKVTKQMILNPETVYWKTHIVNSPTFARFVFELKEFENLASQCLNYMCKQRGLVMASIILDIVNSYRYSIDAKSSESLRDKNNTQSTLIDKINRNKIEKAFTVKGEAKKSLIDGLLGREAREETEGY